MKHRKHMRFYDNFNKIKDIPHQNSYVKFDTFLTWNSLFFPSKLDGYLILIVLVIYKYKLIIYIG